MSAILKMKPILKTSHITVKQPGGELRSRSARCFYCSEIAPRTIISPVDCRILKPFGPVRHLPNVRRP
jgi:hypothetical protein